jgi:ribulose-5-phosphate 4-epimerase/fuculose-1-phosphate aldolase
VTISAPARTEVVVAAATRALAVAGIFDMHGHISIRVDDVAYVNGHSASRIAVAPDEIAVVGIADGAVRRGIPPSEFPIHRELYRARADVGAIAHYHALYATALAVAGKPLVAAFNAGASFGREVPVFDDPRLVRDESRGRALAAVVAKGNAAVLRGHGAVVVAKDIVTCVALALQLEESARRLWLAYAVGEPRRFTDAELESVAENLGEPRVVRKIWIDALERARLAGAMTGIDTEKLV